MRPDKYEWTEERVALLRKLLHEQKPTKQIAYELGTTQNSVIGKANRLGVEGRPKGRPTTDRPAPLPKRKHGYSGTAEASMVRAIVSEHIEEIPIAPIDPNDGVEFMDLQRWHCRAPIGIGERGLAKSCGRPKANGSSYCPEHRARFTGQR